MTAHQKRSHDRAEESISDQACTRCRERKIRCGRELPQCNNCERDDSVTCVYQNPTKRVNHLKSLFDSVNRLNERLDGIESHLGRLSVGITQTINRDTSGSTTSDQPISMDSDLEEGDDQTRSGSRSPYSEISTDLHIFHNPVDLVDHYHGPSSLFVLCKQFQFRVLSTRHTEPDTPLCILLQNLCYKAGALEPFPPFDGKPIINLISKQQASTVISRFFQRVNCTTDVFVKRNLLDHVERMYSGTIGPGNDVWTICLQVITVLVWGTEISTQYGIGLFGDFARSFLPSRAALVSSSLLTTPKLINVQTLILLSVAAQQFDPPGWAEFIFSNACRLARTMGLHQAQLFPDPNSTSEVLERAKVLQSLYVRDKSLCTTRGSVSWLPTHDSGISHQFSTAIERSPEGVAYSATLQLAVIQDQVYNLVHTAASRIDKSTKSHMSKAIQSVEHQFDQYERMFKSSHEQASLLDSNHIMTTLEFLATRMLAFRYGSEQRHIEQVRLDARTSCHLLLKAHGDEEDQTSDAHNTTNRQTSECSSGDGYLPGAKSSTSCFASILDAFSVPAFFIILEDLLQGLSAGSGSDTNLNLLHRVSACYNQSTEQMQPNSYHRTVAWTFEQLLEVHQLLTSGPVHSDLIPVSPEDPMAQMVLSLNTDAHDGFDLNSYPSHKMGDGSSLSSASQLTTSTPFSWDLGSSIPSPLGIYAPFTPADVGDGLDTGIIDMFGELRKSSPNDSSGCFLSLPEACTEQRTTRKRPRTLDRLDAPIEDKWVDSYRI